MGGVVRDASERVTSGRIQDGQSTTGIRNSESSQDATNYYYYY